jgi:hypothetical protein
MMMQRIDIIVCALVVWLLTAALAETVWPLPLTNDISPSDLIPPSSWRKDFKITAGKDQGRLVPLISRPDQRDARRWQVIFGDYAAIHLLREPGGTLLMERLDLIKSRNYVVYEPALPVLPAALNGAATFQHDTGYKMFSLETGKLKRAGRITHRVKRISNSEFDTPAGPMNGYYIEIDHLMEMEYYSQLRLTLGLGCRMDEGPIFGAGQYTITRLGFFSETKTAAAALAKK